MSRRKQAKPRSLKRDEEWDDINEQYALDNLDHDCEASAIKPEDDEDEDEELQRAFSRASDEYLQEDGPPSLQGPDLENQNSFDSEALGTGSSSWHSEDGGPVSRRGGDTPSSCATPTSASFPSEPEAEGENGPHADMNNPAAPYPCQFCDRSFPRLSYLKKHEQSHGDQMPYKCSWCARLFKHKRSRDRHVKLHTGDRRYRCTHCEAAFSRSDHLKIHMKTHDTQKPYQCTACSRGYNTAAALTSHMQSHKKHHHGITQNSKLDSDFGRRSVSSHSTASPPVPNSPSPSLNLTLASRNQGKGSPMVPSASSTPVLHSPMKLACMYCTRDSFTSMQQLQMHVHAMHRAILSGDNRTMPSPGQVSEVSSLSRERMFDSQEKPFKEQEKKLSDERQEKGSEGGNNLCVKTEYFDNSGFSCGQCTMKFSNLGTLRDHLISIHRVDGFGATLMCPLCGIPCISAAAYAEHYVLQHCDDRRINYAENSDYADLKTTSRNSLKADALGYGTNKSSRDSERAVKQSDRESAEPKMATNGNYEAKDQPADLTNKHGRSGEVYSAGTLLCGQCGAALKDFESFREHLARHLQADHRKEVAKNPCPKCDASFQDREEMLGHLTKHFLGQVTKEYACGVCKKFYPHPDLLQRHLLDSHAHHLYRCALCRDTFDSRVAIQVHFAVKHSQECRVYRCSVCPTTNNENSPGNSPGGGNRNLFRSEAEMASHVRAVHAPPVAVAEGPMMPRSPATTPGTLGANLRCVFCGVCCGSDLELQLHLANHSASLYRCPICREGFAVEFLLDKHMQSHHLGGLPTGQTTPRENGRVINPRASHGTEDPAGRVQKRGRSPANSNNNSVSQRDNNNKRPNHGSNAAQHCELCERGEFANDAELQAHKKLAHTPPKAQNKALATLSLTCAYCGEVCRSRSELESHTRVQHASNEPGGRHKCNICDEVCPSGSTLAEHKLQKHCKILLSDTCFVCRGVLNSENQFLEHIQRHSLENVDPQQRVDNSLPHLPSPCVICRQTLITDLECRLHARYHLRASSSQNSSPNLSRKSPNPSCCICLRESPAEDVVNLPSNPVTGGNQSLQVCKSCYARHTQGLPILHSPYEHVRHGAGKEDRTWDQAKWESKISAKDFTRVQEAAVNPSDEEVRRCDDCGVKFEAPEELEAHRTQEHPQREENQPKTYTCIQCQISFATEAEIQKHVRKEHLESTGKPCTDALRCHLCLTEASSPLQLQAHLIEHTFAGCAALSCYICQALFTAPAGLQNHMLQQHGLGARPYDCNLCSLKFFFRAELDHHVITSHRSGGSVSPGDHQPTSTAVTIRNLDGDNKETEQRKSHEVRVKDEMVAGEEEDVNVDEQGDEEARDRDQEGEERGEEEVKKAKVTAQGEPEGSVEKNDS
ncbi:zinc finger protein 423 homolog isoform X1 [Neodiprion pinetum]|uniref:zinc finger protein 423 homolog isoform X1 n=2 Tax=Neodiprion pinetum TaxID=441929 RepID=UPI001EDE39CA|nr:zinc finger protein 423 isoform X1 [Neodiprion pinetum]